MHFTLLLMKIYIECYILALIRWPMTNICDMQSILSCWVSQLFTPSPITDNLCNDGRRTSANNKDLLKTRFITNLQQVWLNVGQHFWFQFIIKFCWIINLLLQISFSALSQASCLAQRCCSSASASALSGAALSIARLTAFGVIFSMNIYSWKLVMLTSSSSSKEKTFEFWLPEPSHIQCLIGSKVPGVWTAHTNARKLHIFSLIYPTTLVMRILFYVGVGFIQVSEFKS